MDEQALEIRERVAAQLEAEAETLTDTWLEELQRRLRVRQVRLLPTEELRDHVPLVVAAVARALRVPGHQPADEVNAHLLLLAELRREQSYPVVELLREFQILTELLFAEVGRILADSSCPTAQLSELFQDLELALSRIGIIAVESYQEAFLREKERLSEQLSGLAETLEHELRTPLQAATTGVDMLRDATVAADPERREQYAGFVQERLTKLGRLLTELRELAVAEHAIAREDRQPIRAVIQSVVDELHGAAREADVSISIEEPLAEILVDPSRVEVALFNLVHNAIKYADPDKPDRWVRLSLHETETGASPRWLLAVADNGLGIPTELVGQVFQRRVRAHPERAAGTGLGLAIVKEVMEQRGGAVHVDSEAGAGSTFTLELTPRLAEPERGNGGSLRGLPLAQPDEPEQPDEPDEPDEPDGP